MAAVLTLSALALAADGKTLTATISGGTGTGYAISSTATLAPHTNTTGTPGGQQWSFPVASASVSGTTLTVNLTIPAAQFETVQFDIGTGSTLTDSGANTATGQTNLAVTNNSTTLVTVYTIQSNASVFEINSNDPAGAFGLRSTNTITGNADNSQVEFVADATEIAVYAINSSTTSVAVDGATSTTNLSNTVGTWGIKPVTTSPITAGKHLVRVNIGDFFYGARVSGSNKSIVSQQSTRAAVVNNSGLVNASATSPVQIWGAYVVTDATKGVVGTNPYLGTTFEFAFQGSGVEISTVNRTNGKWAASIDGQAAGALLPAGDASNNNTFGFVPLSTGTAVGSHNVTAWQLSDNANVAENVLRILIGTTMAASSAIGDGTISVANVSNFAVGDWVRIDYWSKREWRQITNITGTGPYTLTLNATLAIAHASATAVSGYRGTGTVTAYKSADRSRRRIVRVGDSNTQGYNQYGFNGTADPSGTFYVLYDPRQSAGGLAAAADGTYEDVCLGIQGTTTADWTSRTADLTNYSHGAADAFEMWLGTNDINNNTTTPVQYQANIQALVTAALANLRTGGKIFLIPPATPSTTSANGLNIATCTTALQNIAATNPDKIAVRRIDQALVTTDYDGLHYQLTGRQKIGAEHQSFLSWALMSGAHAA